MSKYTEAVEKNLKGIKAVSVGCSDSCDECKESCLEDSDGSLYDEGGFSSTSCGVCNSYLGGDRYIWHWIDEDGNVMHESDCCADCIMYLANGEEPENWEG